MASPSAALRSTFLDVLSKLLAPDVNERRLAEQHLDALAVTEEYGLILTELTLSPTDLPLALRQMTSVLLKQYVDAHWSSLAEKFVPPEVPPAVKASIRKTLPNGLRESISKIRSSVAYTISAIAHWDWPDEWPEIFDLLMAGLQDRDDNVVQGSVRVLKEFSRDLTDSQIPNVAPVILPDTYRIFMETEKYSVRTRARCIEIFSTLSSMICAMGEVDRSLSKSLLSPILPTFTHALVTALHVPDSSHATDPGLKTEVLKALTVLLKNVPRSMASWQGHIIPPVWQTLTSAATKYVDEVVNASLDLGDNENEVVDSDGEVLGLENLVFAIFETVDALMEAPRYRAAVKAGLADLLYYVVVYMQITEEQCDKWTGSPDTFVEDEDEDNSFAFNVRIKSQELLTALCEEFEDDYCTALIQTIERHVTEAEQSKQAGNPRWWKIHEAVMLALGSSQDVLVKQIRAGTASFDLGLFLQNVVLPDMVSPASPFLLGRCLWIGSKFPEQLSESSMAQFVETTVRGLQGNQIVTVRISAVRAIWGFCSYLKGKPQCRRILMPVLPAIFDCLVAMCTNFNNSSEILGLVLENLTVVLSCDEAFTASCETKISPLAIAIFLKYNSDPVLINLTQDVFKVISQNKACLAPLQQRLVPTLVSMLDAHPDKIAPGLQAVALDVLQTLVRASQPPDSSQGHLSHLLLNTAFPTAARCTLNTDDNSIMQSGGECLRAYVSVAPDEVCAFVDHDGKSGLWYIVQVAGHLLNPMVSEFTATFVGRLIITVIRKTGDKLGEHLELLLKAVLSKLQGSQTLSVVQSLLMVYAHLIHTQLHAVLTFLSSVPGPSGETALAFVLTEWVSRQHVFYGAYENKISITALAKILQHGVNTSDARLKDILVKGDLIIPSHTAGAGQNRVRTRLQAKKTGPDQYTSIPVLVKIFKLIVGEMTNNVNEALATSQTDGEDDENYDEEEEEDDGSEEWQDDDHGMDGTGPSPSSRPDGSIEISRLLDPALAIYQDEDDDEDPDDLSDPLYRINLSQYLTEFLQEFCKQPYFLPHFSKHLTPVEVKALTSIGIQLQ